MAARLCFARAERQPTILKLPIEGRVPKLILVKGPAVPDATKPGASIPRAPCCSVHRASLFCQSELLNSLWKCGVWGLPLAAADRQGSSQQFYHIITSIVCISVIFAKYLIVLSKNANLRFSSCIFQDGGAFVRKQCSSPQSKVMQ